MARSPESTLSSRPGQTPHALEFASLCASVCQLAAAIFDLPIAFLKLNDGTVAATGMTTGALDRFAFTDRPLDGPLLVSDATRDGRFFLENAVLTGPRIRFYADTPLMHDGQVLGVLGVAEPLPRQDFNAAKLALLDIFASQAATLLALAKTAQTQTELLGELQARQARLDSELTGLGYWKIDLKTREVTWSQGFYTLIGLTPKTYTPTVATLLDIFEPEDRSMVIERFQAAVNSAKDFDFQVKVLDRKDKAMRLVRMRGGIEKDAGGEPVRLCAVVRDLSDAGLPARDINAAKDEFLAHVTNELRRPLNDILGYARLLDTKAQLNPDIATYTHDLLQSAQALQQTLGQQSLGLRDLMTPAPAVSEDDMASEDLTGDEEVVDVTDVIRETVNAFTEQAAANGTRLGAHFSDFARTTAQLDVMRVQQVLQNLIANACKYTQGGVISVAASQVEAQNPVTFAPETHLHVSVRDTGAGMSADQTAGLFSGRTRGLGLSISKTIVEMLGGRIGVTSQPGEGTTAWFEIPVVWAKAVAPVSTAARDPKATPVPTTLARETFTAETPPAARRPAYAPIRPSLDDMAAKAHPPVDADRINREYLRALLADMKLDLH